MSAVLYEVESNGKTWVIRSKAAAIRFAKDKAEMEHVDATVVATRLRTMRVVRTTFKAK